MSTLGDFLNAGQQRRAWLNDTLESFIPPELRGWVNVAGEMNPVTNAERAGTAAQTMVQPGLSGWDRMAAAGDVASNMAAVLAPVGAASKTGVPAANAIAEALTAVSPMKGAVDDFLVDEFGGVGFRAYHGSPHDFDKFSLDKIGTGEGAQAYGHGLYFAENEGVARGYRDALRFPRVDSIASPRDAVIDDLNYHRGNVEGLRGIYQGMVNSGNAEAAKVGADKLALLDSVVSDMPGRMYEVNINADPADFLDWDKPLSEQSPAIRDAFSSLGTPERLASVRGEDAYRALGSQMGALDWPVGADAATRRSFYSNAAVKSSEALQDRGIPGIRYLDAGSRGAGDGSRNYVVFDDKLIEILRKYGLAGAVPMGAVLGQPQDPLGSYIEAQ